MASYIQGLNGYVPQVQPFTPDFNFLQNTIERRQSQYDQGYERLSSVYGSLLNSPLTRDVNIERKDAFFKSAEQQIKKLAGVDLSLQQNVQSAYQIFEPYYNDPNIVKDMSWTKTLNREKSKAERLRNCLSCEEKFWEGGLTGLSIREQMFKNSSDEQALQFKNPHYVSHYDLAKFAKIAADDFGAITTQTDNGKWITTTKNGSQLTIPLANYLMTTIGQDPKAAAYYTELAFINRMTGGGNFYEKLSTANNASTQTAVEESNRLSHLTSKRQLMEKEIFESGVLPTGQQYHEYHDLLESIKVQQGVSDYSTEVSEGGDAIVNNSGEGFMNENSDVFMGQQLMQQAILQSAQALSMRGFEQTKEANPYGVASYKDRLQANREKAQRTWQSEENRKDRELKLLLNPPELPEGAIDPITGEDVFGNFPATEFSSGQTSVLSNELAILEDDRKIFEAGAQADARAGQEVKRYLEDMINLALDKPSAKREIETMLKDMSSLGGTTLIPTPTNNMQLDEFYRNLQDNPEKVIQELGGYRQAYAAVHAAAGKSTHDKIKNLTSDGLTKADIEAGYYNAENGQRSRVDRYSRAVRELNGQVDPEVLSTMLNKEGLIKSDSQLASEELLKVEFQPVRPKVHVFYDDRGDQPHPSTMSIGKAVEKLEQLGIEDITANDVRRLVGDNIDRYGNINGDFIDDLEDKVDAKNEVKVKVQERYASFDSPYSDDGTGITGIHDTGVTQTINTNSPIPEPGKESPISDALNIILAAAEERTFNPDKVTFAGMGDLPFPSKIPTLEDENIQKAVSIVTDLAGDHQNASNPGDKSNNRGNEIYRIDIMPGYGAETDDRNFAEKVARLPREGKRISADKTKVVITLSSALAAKYSDDVDAGELGNLGEEDLKVTLFVDNDLTKYGKAHNKQMDIALKNGKTVTVNNPIAGKSVIGYDRKTGQYTVDGAYEIGGLPDNKGEEVRYVTQYFNDDLPAETDPRAVFLNQQGVLGEVEFHNQNIMGMHKYLNSLSEAELKQAMQQMALEQGLTK